MITSETVLPQAITLYLTYHCELHCSHCFINRAGLLNGRELKMDAISELITDAAAHKVVMLAITGGSPLLHQSLFDIIALARAERIMPILGITGVDIDAYKAWKIARSGVASVQLSLDGPDDATNAYYRGPGVFDRVLRSIRNIRDAQVPVILAICLDAFNYLRVHDMLALALGQQVYTVKVAFWSPGVFNSAEEKHIELSESQKNVVRRTCLEFENQYELRHWIHVVDVPDDDVRANRVATGRVVVDPFGDVRLHEDAQPIGNIYHEKLSKIYTNHFRKIDSSNVLQLDNPV